MEMTRAQGNGELRSSAENVCVDDEKAWRADGGGDSKTNVNVPHAAELYTVSG